MARMQRGLTPYQAELFMWERQMREIRKIYRAQYLQRLAEVTEEERRKQLELYLQEKQERRLRREEQLQRIYEDKKRRAVLKDRIRIEKKVTQSLQTARVSRRKIGHLLWLKKLQDAADFMQRQEEGLRAAAATAEKEASGVEEEEEVLAREMSRVKDDAFRQIDTRHISVPDLLAQLGQNDEKVKSVKKKITGTDNVFRTIMEESFAILPEDGPEFDEEGGEAGRAQREHLLTERQRAVLSYMGFTEQEKLALLDEKISMLNRKLDEDYELRGAPQNLMYLQLRDHLQAAKLAFQERKYIRETQERLNRQRQAPTIRREDSSRSSDKLDDLADNAR